MEFSDLEVAFVASKSLLIVSFHREPRFLPCLNDTGFLAVLYEDEVGDIFNSKFEANSVTAHAVQTGVRLTGVVQDQLYWKTGAAYEYVFGGEAEGTLKGLTLDIPAIDGGSGIFEAAVALKPSVNSPWKGELGVKAYAGARECVTANFMIRRSF